MTSRARVRWIVAALTVAAAVAAVGYAARDDGPGSRANSPGPALTSTAAAASPGTPAPPPTGSGPVSDHDTAAPAPTTRPAPATSPAPRVDPATSIDDALLLAFTALADQAPGVLGLAWVDASGPHTLGALQAEPVWSTIKVPVAIAGLRAADDAWMNTLVDSAITVSDNASSYAIWDRLGAGDVAADAVEAELTRFAGAEGRAIELRRDGLGATVWSLGDQVTFARSLACREGDDPAVAAVLRRMRAIAPEQRWGLGAFPTAAFKGGWGPDAENRYLVRQFGFIDVQGGRYAVALAARPASGLFDDATAMLDGLASWFAGAAGPAARRGGFSCPEPETRPEQLAAGARPAPGGDA